LAPLSLAAQQSTEPVITKQPVNRSVLIGNRAIFRVLAEDPGPLRYRWYKDGRLISGANSFELVVENVQLEDEGLYHARIWNADASVNSEPARLRILLPPTITSQPRNFTADPGTEAFFEVKADGSTPLKYQWFKNAIPLLKQTSPTLTIKSVKASDEGTYTVEISNRAGSVLSRQRSLSVSVPQELIITTHPRNRSVSLGGEAIFRVWAQGPGSLRYRWYKDGLPITGANSSELIIENARIQDEGQYHARIRNADATVNSEPARLRVLLPPTITSQPRNLTAAPGTDAQFEVKADGSTPLKYQWFKNGIPLLKQTSPTLAINAVKASDEGNYTIEISNRAGSVLSEHKSLSLSLDAPPVETSTKLTFSWSPNSESYVVGYRFYYKIKSQSKYDWKEVSETRITLDGLIAGQTYVFHVTALATFGIESSPSEQITHTIPLQTLEQNPVAALGNALSLETENPPNPIDSTPLSDVEITAPALLFLQNQESYLAAWHLEKSTVQSASFLNPYHPGDPNWTLVGAADLNHNNRLELVFQHADGMVAIWFMEESGIDLNYALLFEHDLPTPDWRLAAVADLDSNGELDFVFQNQKGFLAVCFSENGLPKTTEFLNPFPGEADWELMGAGRFREDLRPGLLFQHADSSLVVWFTEGATLTEKVFLIPDHPGDPDWRVAALADLNGDRSQELVFQHVDGSLAVWFLDETVLRETEMIQFPGGTWRLSAP
jgi:hypothetical protein